jgi:hypothetical protein
VTKGLQGLDGLAEALVQGWKSEFYLKKTEHTWIHTVSAMEEPELFIEEVMRTAAELLRKWGAGVWAQRQGEAEVKR